eukprot:9967100-Alexandrium_andersonii.AAC.1
MPARAANPATSPHSASLASPSQDSTAHRAVITLRPGNTKVSDLLLPLKRPGISQRSPAPRHTSS